MVETGLKPLISAMGGKRTVAAVAAKGQGTSTCLRGGVVNNQTETERGYAKAAQLARSHGDPVALAHALRHISELARERGASAEASQHASEAVALYRGSGDQLGLANAIRLQALSAGVARKPPRSGKKPEIFIRLSELARASRKAIPT
jgi:hypothetical protein